MLFRIDRFLALYFFHPLVNRISPRKVKVPILMYHSISRNQKDGLHPYFETATDQIVFSEQMEFLKNEGYEVVGLEDINRLQSRFFSHEKKYVVITFDDGYADIYKKAYPILKRHRFPSTIFLPAKMMGQKLNNRPCMTWEQARELVEAGINFGSHSLTHPELVKLCDDEIMCELKNSKEIIENELKENIFSFSYPFAFPEHDKLFCSKIEGLLRRCGYSIGVTTVIGRSSSSDNRYFLKRLPVNTYDDIALFKAKLEGGYDWLRTIQKLSKQMRYKIRR